MSPREVVCSGGRGVRKNTDKPWGIGGAYWNADHPQKPPRAPRGSV